MKRLLFTLVFIFINFSFCLSADLTLEEAIKDALNNNPDISIAEDKVKQAELKLKSIKPRFCPNLSLNAGYNPITDRYGVSFSISQDLDQIIRGNKNERENALLDLEIAKKQLLLIQQKVIKEVTEAYYNLKLAKDNLKLKEDIFDSRYKSLEFAQAKFDLGKLSLDELLSKQKEVEEARFALFEARQKLKKEELNLLQLRGKTK